MVDSALNDLKFLNRLQEEFEPEEMTAKNLKKWLKSGDNPLIDVLARTGLIYNEAKETNDLSDLNDLLDQSDELEIYGNETKDFIKSRIKAIREEIKKHSIKLRSGRERSGLEYNRDTTL